MTLVAAQRVFERVKVAPLTPSIGAEISGIDLADEQDDATIAEIRAALLAYLYAQAAVPEIQCRFRWRAGSVAFWDNRAAQHYAASDYFPAVRRMERVTIAGDRPFYRDER